MKQISVTVTVGVGSERHNHDLEYRATLEHVHGTNGVIELIPYYKTYEEQINELMRSYIDEYNQKQQERYQAAWERYNTGQIKTKPRKANYKPISYDYYNEHKDDTFYNRVTNQQEALPIFRSVIIGLGDKEDRDKGVISKKDALDIIQNIANKWPTFFPDFKLLGATLHTDEDGFYHAHFDYKPLFDHDSGQGLSAGIGQESALEHMGFEPEQSLINGSDKVPIRFNAFRNKLYLEIEKELNKKRLGLLYGASKIKEPDKDSSKNQRLENWQATRDAANELQLMKNKMIEIVTGDEVSVDGYNSALEAYSNIKDTLEEIEQQPRSRLNKDSVVVPFKLLDQLKSFVKSLIDNMAHLMQQLDIANEWLNVEQQKNAKMEKELESLRPLKYYGTPDFKMKYAELRNIARLYEATEKENKELRKALGIGKNNQNRML